MTVLLSEIVEGTLRKLGALQVNVATGGTTTTIVDSDLGGSDDDFNGGTAIIIRDSAGAGAAPENEFSEVTDYATGTGTLTVNTLTVAPASGDVYGVSTGKDYPHYQVIASPCNIWAIIRRWIQLRWILPVTKQSTQRQ
jgi:hypothetical protein